MDMNTILPFLNSILLVAATVGGFFAFRSSRNNTIISVQKDTIQALQDQVNALESKVTSLSKENVYQQSIIELIQSAMMQAGYAITISGDMVSVKQETANQITTSSVRRPLATIAQGLAPGVTASSSIAEENVNTITTRRKRQVNTKEK